MKNHIFIKTFLMILVMTTLVLPKSEASFIHRESQQSLMEEFVQSANLIFRGRVVSVDYANSREGSEEEPSLPHTFVTYKILETYKGRTTDSEITLRFLGGVNFDEDGEYQSFLEVSIAPSFDVGEEDILFVKDSETALCSLVGCSESRLRVVDGQMFSNEGQELLIDRDELSLGRSHELDEVNSHDVAGLYTERVVSGGGGDLLLGGLRSPTQTPLGVSRHSSLVSRLKKQKFERNPNHASVSDFVHYLEDLIESLHSLGELRCLPVIESADIDAEFTVELPRKSER